jgi:hypothetical protein
MKKQLSKLAKVELRDVWGHEAIDFTNWLAQEDNLDLLSEEIGTTIKLIQTEAGVGKFNVDILAEEEASGRKIIIENQLENTDHEHLGKIITYASGYDAEIVIWIVKDIREEHQRAIEWLNEHTDENISFFLIKIELWQIEGSNPAPKFDIAASPNEWAKTIKSSRTNDSLTNTKLQQLEFWKKFKDYVKEQKNPKIRLQTPRPQHWYDVTMGSSDAHLCLTINSRDNIIGCELYISRNKDLYNYLVNQTSEIEKEIGDTLEWIEATVAARIKNRHGFSNVFNQESWQQQYEWLYNQILIFKKVFGKYIKEFKNQA